MFDCIIIGAGPAGITAGIYAVRKRMNFTVITKDIGGQTNWTARIENYTGYQFIPGEELVKRFKEHLGQFKVDVREWEIVSRVERGPDGVMKVVTDKAEYECRTLIVASGMTHRKLNVPGEDRLLGKGLAYCATCDAPLFADMDVAVVGGGNSALDAAIQLERIARRIYIIDVAPSFRADPITVEKVTGNPKVVIYHGAPVKEITGEQFVNGIAIEHEGTLKHIPVEGVFVEIGWKPATDFIDFVEKNERGEICVNCKSETSAPGVFAAGDVSNVPAKQIIVACGEGAKAALAAFSYLNETRETVAAH